MKNFLGVMILGLLLCGNAYSKITNLICKLDYKDTTAFPVMLDDENKNAIWHDKTISASFSAATVKFNVAKIEQSPGIYVVMFFEISRINLDIVQTLKLIVEPSNNAFPDKIVSRNRGKCEIGKVIETQF